LAVPINEATIQIITTLMRSGRVRRAYLGIATTRRPLPPRLARSLGQEAGIAVMEVGAGSPAQVAGISVGDLLLSVAGQLVQDAGDLQRVMVEEAIGQAQEVRLLRNGEIKVVSVVPAELQTRQLTN
jgi:S1-C subfamily serine protease